MKRSLLLLALAVFALGFAAVPQSGEKTTATDERHRVAYGIDPITGEYLFAQDIDPLSFISSGTSPPDNQPTGSTIQMQLVETLPTPAVRILSRPTGFDLDHNAKREFIFLEYPEGGANYRHEFHESVADDTFDLVHVLDWGSVIVGAFDGGDADQDGLAELTTAQIDGGTFVRLYESLSTDTYPTQLVWESNIAPGSGGVPAADFADTDGDGAQEIVVVARSADGMTFRLTIYENEGDNSFGETFYQDFPELNPFAQSAGVMDDLDGDGRPEILFGGLTLDGAKLIAVESTGNDAYGEIWSAEMEYEGSLINTTFIVDGGDLDGDGKKEFLAGGLKANPPFQLVAHLFEAVSDNNFQIVATFAKPYGTLESFSLGAVADVDGDGDREIVLGSGTTLRIYENTGNDVWHEIWSNTMGFLFGLGAGDHDEDGKEELIVSEGGPSGFTGIWEIDPADAADMDNDHVVDVIDNCPVTPNSTQEDADNDTVGDACDNCIYGFNPEQGAAIFGQAVVAEDSQTFSWPVAADVVYVKGDLSDVSTYTVDLVDSVAFTSELTDSSVPATGAGFYYLVRPDCVVGSWQTSLGAEPGRDLVLP